MKKQRVFHSKHSKPYWGVLARDTAFKPFLTPNIFMKLLQSQYPNTNMPGKDKQPDDRLHS